MENLRRRRGRPAKMDARRNKLDIRLSDRELARIHLIADAHSVSANEAVRIALNEYFERRRV